MKAKLSFSIMIPFKQSVLTMDNISSFRVDDYIEVEDGNLCRHLFVYLSDSQVKELRELIDDALKA